jgi:hypothetical protein
MLFCLVVRIFDCCFQNNFGAALFLVESEVQLLFVLGLHYILSGYYLLCVYYLGLEFSCKYVQSKSNFLCSLQLEIKRITIFKTRMYYI